MTFKDKMQAAGFKTQAEFAKYLEKHRETVSQWKGKPPGYALRTIEERMKNKELRRGFVEDLLALAEKYNGDT